MRGSITVSTQSPNDLLHRPEPSQFLSTRWLGAVHPVATRELRLATSPPGTFHPASQDVAGGGSLPGAHSSLTADC